MIAFWRMRWFDGIHKKPCSTSIQAAIICTALSSMRQHPKTRKDPHMFMDYVVLILP